jgi:hypothetical protein
MQSPKRLSASLFLASVLVAAIGTLPAQAADLLSGTWKGNISKSSWSPASTAPRDGGTTTIKVNQDEITLVSDGVNAQGQKTHLEYKAKFDGKDYPVTNTLDGKPNPDAADSMMWSKMDDHNYQNVSKLKGQVLVTTRRTIAMDGKSFTNRMTGKNAQGQTVNNTVVYEKQ